MASNLQSQKPWGAYALLAPFFLFLGLFWLVPLLQGMRSSLFSNVLYGEPTFVGFTHYQELWQDERFATALQNTALYALATLVFILPLSLWLAQALQGCLPRLRPVLTFGLLLPGLTPPAVLALLFLLVFHGEQGLLNRLFVTPFGLEAVQWLKDPRFILPALILQAVWRWTGFVTFFILAGMEAVPRILYEAAHLESNCRWQVFRRVTLPHLRPVLLFAAVYLVVDAFSLFSGAYVLLGGSGGTNDAGLLLVSYIYQTAFAFGKFGTAAAVGVMVAPLLLGLLWVCFLIPRRWHT